MAQRVVPYGCGSSGIKHEGKWVTDIRGSRLNSFSLTWGYAMPAITRRYIGITGDEIEDGRITWRYRGTAYKPLRASQAAFFIGDVS